MTTLKIPDNHPSLAAGCSSIFSLTAFNFPPTLELLIQALLNKKPVTYFIDYMTRMLVGVSHFVQRYEMFFFPSPRDFVNTTKKPKMDKKVSPFQAPPPYGSPVRSPQPQIIVVQQRLPRYEEGSLLAPFSSSHVALLLFWQP